MNEFPKHIVSYSKDEEIRLNSSSGGFCKSFLCFLIEKKIVDYVILTRMKENSTSPETIITNKKEKIINRTNSIYEYNDQTKILSQLDKCKTYAFIGLPCFTRFIKNKKSKYSNIKLTISLLCNQAPSCSFKKHLLKDNDVKEKELEDIDYRSGKHPGRIQLFYNNGNNKILDGFFPEYWKKYNYEYKFAPKCCLKCNLYEGLESDISAGDAWPLPKYNKPEGWTKLLVRNNYAMNLIHQAHCENYIYYEEDDSQTMPKSDFIRKQKFV